LPCILKDTKNQTLNKTIDRNYKKFVKLNISCATGTTYKNNSGFCAKFRVNGFALSLVIN